MLHDFISEHRQALIKRTSARARLRFVPRARWDELETGVSLFLTQLGGILRHEVAQPAPDGPNLESSATRQGRDLLEQGLSIAHVVYNYGDICQAITELALELRVPLATEDFHVLNLCLDDAIASAVTEYARQRDVETVGAEVKRRGFFAHELRNHLNTAALAFQAVKSGKVGITGSTVGVLERSLQTLRTLVDHSVTEVRLAAGLYHRERIRLVELIDEIEADTLMQAMNRELLFTVERGDRNLEVDADRQLLASAVSNLLQNAFKFTPPGKHVWLRTRSTGEHVRIEIEDQGGGMQMEAAEAVWRPFEQRGENRTGLGLGLTISREAVEANGGRLSLRNMPGTGCIFVIELPLAVPAPSVV